MPEWDQKSLECPECAAKVAWNGEQFVCGSCAWTEFRAKPPSDRNIEVPPQDPPPES